MTALSISDATREHSETDIRDRKSDLANRDHDEEESGVSNGSTTASSVCNSVTSHEHSVLPNNPENNEKLENGKVQLGTGTVNGEVHTADLLRPEVTLNGTENNFISFDLPELHTLNIRPQTEFLLLAWALLVYRNTEGGNDAHFSWSFDDAAKLASNQNKISGETGSSTVVQTLDAIQKLENGFNELARVRADNLKIIIGTVTCSREQTAQWNCTLEARSSGKELRIRQPRSSPPVPYNVALANINAFVDILESTLSNQSQTIAKAVQVGPRELAQIWQWNSTVPPTIHRCMHDIISEKAKEDPYRNAVTSWDGDMTYGILERLSTQLAIRLTELGVGVGETVPLCFEKSMWTVVGVLAVMKAGGAFVLTDPHQPEARLQIIAQEVGAKIILTSHAQAELGSRIAPKAQVVALGEELLKGNEILSSDGLPQVPSSSILYIIFTSGSTGRPKGVVISHASYTSGAIPRAYAVGYRAHSRVLDFASYAFDVSIDCMLATLSQGGCICVPSDEARVNDLSGAIRSMNVNMAHMTPSVARVLETDAGVMESLEVLGLGGELVSAGDARSFGQKTKIIIAYGPSECTVGCTINNDVGVERNYTTIGKGVGAVTWIVDPDNHNILTPIGGVGELIIEGPVVGDGYLHDETNTSLVFIEDPKWLPLGAGHIPGRHGRLYKTGDMVKYSPDGRGFLVFMGRKDRQVKLRGQRIELAEIEHHLRANLPGSISVAVEVITPGGKIGPQTLVAFISEPKSREGQETPKLGSEATSGELTTVSTSLKAVLADIDKILAVNLPIYMIPTAYIPLKEMPLLVSCKTDRKKLQGMGQGMSQQQLSKFRVESVEKHKPRTVKERSIHGLWARIFGSGIEIGINDSFFNLGGDSLKAMKMVAEARAEKGLVLTVADIFMHPTLAGMALKARQADAESNLDIPGFSLLASTWNPDTARTEVAKLCGLDVASIEDIYPCTPLQEGLMALSAKVSEAYIAQRVVELVDQPTAQRLQAAFDTVVADCPIMRTRVVQVTGYGLMQAVVNEAISWTTSNNLEKYLDQDRDITMDLGQSLARFAVIFDANTNKSYVVLTIHHALYDGWSMPLIVERVNKVYQGLKSQLPTPFKAFIKYLSSTDGQSSAAYWRDQLEGATKPQFPPLPHPGYQQQANSLLELHIPFSKATVSSTTIATAIRGAWAIVAGQYTASNDVVFGETLTGRNAPVVGVESIEGPMITTVPVRVRINGDATIAEYLQDIHNQTVSRISHEHMGLQHIRRLSPDARKACDLRTGLVLHPNVEDEGQNANMVDSPANGFVPAGDADAAREAVKFNSYGLMLVCSLGADGVLIMASFDSNMVEVNQMNRMLEQLGRVLQYLCEDTSTCIKDVVILDDDDQAKLWRLSNSGPLSIKEAGNKAIGSDFKATTATWIVDPDDPEVLLPIGAIGELLVEVSTYSSECCINTPRWLAKGCKGYPGREAQLYPTGQLCKYKYGESIVFIEAKTKQNVQSIEVRQINGLRKIQPHITPREKELFQLWSRVLAFSTDDLGTNDSFFDLGGDSIAAMKLVSEARMAGIKLTMAQIFKYRHLSDMASVLEESQPSTAISSKVVPFSTLDVKDVDSFVSMSIFPKLGQADWEIMDVLPARPLQEVAVHGTFRLPRFSARYEIFYFDTPVEKTRLLRSCQELVSRNEILRTVFVESMNRCFSVVLKNMTAPVVEYEIEGDLEVFSHKLCELDIQTKMPLGCPFVKFLFVQGEHGKSSLLFRISHAQYDEICLPLMLRQLSALYEGRHVSESIEFSSFVNYAVKESIPRSFDYWRELLRDSSMSILRPDIPLESRTAGSVFKSFDISARAKEITIATLPTAAWALCLARTLSSRDVTFGEVVSGRNIDMANCDTVMGPCWQYIPVRVKFEDDWTALDLLNYIQNQHIASSSYESVGLKEIVENCTDWPATTDWFDSVVHQDVDHVETLPFTNAVSRMETVYPHLEPLREWKFQAFVKGDSLTFEIVTFEAWMPMADALLKDLVVVMDLLTQNPNKALFKL